MKKELLIVISVVVIAVIALLGFYGFNQNQPSNTSSIELYDGFFYMDRFIDSVKTQDYFKDYNNETLEWLETFDSKYLVFSGKNIYVVMSKSDAEKVEIEFATDVSIKYTINCNILEKRSLGNNLGDVIYVKDVELVSKNITYLDV